MAVKYHGLVRARDPESSWDAAGQQDTAKVNRVQSTILALFSRHGDMHDETLVERYTAVERTDPTVQRATAQSVRSRRHELQVMGLIRDTGRHGTTSLGNRAAVFGLPERKDPDAA
jgi:hypothetical protein